MTRAFEFTDSPARPQVASLPPISQVAPHPHSHRGGELWPLRNAPLHHPRPLPLDTRFHDTSIPVQPSGAAAPVQPVQSPQTPPIRPQVVDERYIEGRGLCYIYEDGSYCPKSIDGVPVNASWGITKAGKPRKRLAQACVMCREKKIKCRPNLPRCDQCEKAGRECRFESA